MSRTPTSRKTIAAFIVCLASVAVVCALVLFGNEAPVARANHPSTPEEWEKEGYASFASDMAGLYAEYDARVGRVGTVRVIDGLGMVVDGEQTVREAEVTVADGEPRADAWSLLESLGYECSGEGSGIRATNTLRGDEVAVLPGHIEINGAKVDAGLEVSDRGLLTVNVRQLGEALGYEVLPGKGEVVLQDPWETARVVTMGNSDVSDPAAQSVVKGPNDMVVLQYGTVREAREAADRLLASGEASWTGPDRIAHLCDEELQVAANSWQPAEALSWGNAYIGSTEMQMNLVRKYGSVADIPEVVVAVIDSGLDMDHELFAGRLVAGYDFVDDDGDPEATDEHGTHVSGIVVNNTPNNVKVMPLRAEENNELSETAIYSSIEYAISHDADVINMSYGLEYSTRDSWLQGSLEEQAIRDAEQAGIVMVAGHGNEARETSCFFPSSDDAVISVSAISENGKLASFSNYGAPVDLCAPGQSINSSVLDGAYGEQSGTSMATPFVAAASALVLSEDSSRLAADVRETLQNSARDLGDDGWDKYYGYGCVNVANLIETNYVARIGTRGFESFQAAYEAAATGDEIVLLEDVKLDSTFALDKSVTIRSSRAQSISLSDGATLPLFEVSADVTLGDSLDMGRSFAVTAAGTRDSGSFITVAEGATLNLEASVVLSAPIGNGPLIYNKGKLTVNGASIENGSASGSCIYSEGPITLNNCTVSSYANVPAIACAGTLSVEGGLSVNGGISLFGGGYIVQGEVTNENTAQIGVSIEDASQDRLVLVCQGGEESAVSLFYLMDTAWKLVAHEEGYVLARASSSDARIGDHAFQKLSEAVAAAQGGDTIVVLRDVIVAETLELSGAVTVSSEGDNTIKASSQLEGPLMRIDGSSDVSFVCGEGSSLVLAGLRSTRTHSMLEITQDASLTLGEGVKVTGFRSSTDYASPITNGGILLIDGAIVTDNRATFGAGVYNVGKMELKAGEVSGNVAQHSGGGIHNCGELLISGGHVDNNDTVDTTGDPQGAVKSDTEAQGGGIWNLGMLTITGGSVSGNHSNDGGGIYNAGTTKMTGGEISHNNAYVVYQGDDGWTIYSGEGGGVYSSGSFTMSGGSLRENNALSRGGGVSVVNGDMLLTGGEIADNTVDGHGYYEGPEGATFFKACGIYAYGGKLRLAGGSVYSSKQLTDEVLISSYVSTEISGDFALKGGMLWASNKDGSGSQRDGLPIRVASDLSAQDPITVFSPSYASNTVVVTYDDGVQPDVADFALGGFESNPYTLTGGDTLRVERQNLVLIRGDISPSEGWERNGTCEQRLDEDGTFTMRPINGVKGTPLTKPWTQYSEEMVTVRIEEGVVVPDASDFFWGCSKIEMADVSGMTGVVNGAGLFANCTALKEVRLPDLPLLQDAKSMFSDCNSLRDFDVECFLNSKLQSTASMFYGCTSLESLDLSRLDMSQVTDIGGMFHGCASLSSVDCSTWDTSNVSNITGIFSGCTALNDVDVSLWDTSKVLDMRYAFCSCEALTTIDISGWDTSQVEIMAHMFEGCSSLAELDLSRWNALALNDAENMFSGCTSLVSISLPDTWALNVAGAIPDPTTCIGKWWSTNDEAWYSVDEIKNSKNGVADTYTAKFGTPGHQPDSTRENEITATCETGGSYDEVVRCLVCNKVLSNKHFEVKALGHDYVATVVEPTGEHKGYTLYTCSRCGDEYRKDGTVAPAKTFPDVKAGSWYEKVVYRAVALGLMGGYDTGEFGPDDNVTRGQVAVMLWNMAGRPKAGAGAKSFPDVKAGAFYYNAVRWASSTGVVNGFGDGTFKPNASVTREQLAVMLANYARRLGGLDVKGSAADYVGMGDAARVSGYAVPSLGWCFRNKVLSGTADGRIDPQGSTTRAQAAKMFVFVYDMLG